MYMDRYNVIVKGCIIYLTFWKVALFEIIKCIVDLLQQVEAAC